MTDTPCWEFSNARLGTKRAEAFDFKLQITVAVLAATCSWACGEGTQPLPDSGDGTDEQEAGGAPGSGGISPVMPEGSGGASVEPGPLVPDCQMPAAALESITTPSPLISVGLNLTASDGVQNPALVVDGLYHSGGGAIFGLPTLEAPEQVAFEVGRGPTRLLLLWSDVSFNAYNAPVSGSPLSYAIEVSSDSTDGVDGEWTEVVNITDNPVRSRAHSFDFTDQSWVRFVITGGQEGARNVVIDEIELHDISAALDDRPQDTWFFMGDSITMGAFTRSFGVGNFENQLGDLRPDYTPIVINGGIGGEFVTQGIDHLPQWLELNPDFSHIVIAYGTNDSWSDQNVVTVGFEDNVRDLAQAVLDAGRIPILARIPYASLFHGTVPDFNLAIQRVTEELGLACGADLFTYFESNADQLGDDGVHPTTLGYSNMNRVWAETLSRFYAEP